MCREGSYFNTHSTSAPNSSCANSKDANFDVSFSSDKIETSGDLAYSRGRFTEKHSDAANKPVSTSGSYITVYKKQADGSWKVVEDFTAAEPAAAPAAAAPGQ